MKRPRLPNRVRSIVHRGALSGWLWKLNFGRREVGWIGAGYRHGFTFYLGFRCYFQPRGDYRTRFMHVGLTRNANRVPLTRG